MWQPPGSRGGAPRPVATIDAAGSLQACSGSFCNYKRIRLTNEMPNQMSTRRTVSRTLVTLGCIGLIVAAAAHYPAYQKISAPVVRASNLPSAMQSVFEIAFLSMGWSWFVLALIALVAAFGDTRMGKAIILICGFAMLIQTVFSAWLTGLFGGDELTGAAALLIIIGGLLVSGTRVEA
jgi:hypothetical protein